MHRNVRVINQLGEKGWIMTGDTNAVTLTGGLTVNAFEIVTETVFADITSTLHDADLGDITALEGETLTAGRLIILSGVTSYQLTSGKVIAYKTA